MTASSRGVPRRVYRAREHVAKGQLAVLKDLRVDSVGGAVAQLATRPLLIALADELQARNALYSADCRSCRRSVPSGNMTNNFSVWLRTAVAK